MSVFENIVMLNVFITKKANTVHIDVYFFVFLNTSEINKNRLFFIFTFNLKKIPLI